MYHESGETLRVRKRLVLNECFRLIRDNCGSINRFTYITLGGQHLRDVLDLVNVFSIREYRISIFSYEKNHAHASITEKSDVGRVLSLFDGITVNTIQGQFPCKQELLVGVRHQGPFLYFLDYTKTFSEHKAEEVASLADYDLLRPGDYLLITCCVSPRIVHQRRFMAQYRACFRRYFSHKPINRDFRIRNHVELLLERALSRQRRTAKHTNPSRIRVDTLTKYRYRDTMITMGLWLMQVRLRSKGKRKLRDKAFTDFPESAYLK